MFFFWQKRKLNFAVLCPLFGRSSYVSLLKPVLCQSSFWKGASSRLHHAINIWHSTTFASPPPHANGRASESQRDRDEGKKKLFTLYTLSPYTIWLYILSWSVCTLADLICVYHWLVFYFHLAHRWLPQHPLGSGKTIHFGTASQLLKFNIEYCPKIHQLRYSFHVCGSKKANKSQHSASNRQGQSKTLFLERCWSCCLQGLMGFFKGGSQMIKLMGKGRAGKGVMMRKDCKGRVICILVRWKQIGCCLKLQCFFFFQDQKKKMYFN